MIGSVISHYRILAKLGEGGMGVVYRARDTKLDRDVALKVLPEQFARDPQRMGRFEREARVLASLNHPNIASIYGLEESDGLHVLVMELVEGVTLAERLANGPIPMDDALPLARQVAEALEYAHEKGIVHRDLKPTNIMLTGDDAVKVLDFGLAKALEREQTADPADSPTLTQQATRAGVILGTAAYMSPEQARGKPADRRADIWAFGVVLYEMLSGRRLFGGEVITETLAEVLKSDIELVDLPDQTPPAIRRLLRNCLERDRRMRLQAIGDARIELEHPLDAQQEPRVQPVEVRKTSRLPWALLAATALFAIVISFVHFREVQPDLQPFRFSLAAPPNHSFANIFGGYAVSPDGQQVVFSVAGDDGSTTSLWLRPMDAASVRQLAGTEGGSFPFWSPDGHSVAFLTRGQLKRLDLPSGEVTTLTDVAGGSGGLVAPAGAWSSNDVILFASSDGLRRVSASGGRSALLVQPDASLGELALGSPQFLPDGDRFLYSVLSTDTSVRGVYVSSLSDPAEHERILETSSKAVYVPPRAGSPGSLLWADGELLLAQRFDVDALELDGEPQTVARELGGSNMAATQQVFSASKTGLLAYFPRSLRRRVVWMNREGDLVGEAAPPANYLGVVLSPLGDRMAAPQADAIGEGEDIWVWDFARNLPNRVTLNPGNDGFPVWSPDGRRIAFDSDRDGAPNIYVKDASGAGEATPLTEGPLAKLPVSWSSDGKYLLYMEPNVETKMDLMALPLDGEGTPFPVVNTEGTEAFGVISPDGKLVSYSADYTGHNEIYVTSFPGGGLAWQGRERVSDSRGDGVIPTVRWRADSRELYYVNGDKKMMAVAVEAGPEGVRLSSPTELFTADFLAGDKAFDVMPEGDRFLVMLDASAGQESDLNIITNWPATLPQ